MRELVWMVAERKRVMGELAAWHLAGIGALMPFVNAKLDPQAINPYRTGRRMARKVQEVRDFIASRGIAALAGAGS